jgi:hypothetical protein
MTKPWWNDEARMTRGENDEALNTQARRNDEARMTNDESFAPAVNTLSSLHHPPSSFGFRHSFVLGYFVLRHSFMASAFFVHAAAP